jgi:hypothetical protein
MRPEGGIKTGFMTQTSTSSFLLFSVIIVLSSWPILHRHNHVTHLPTIQGQYWIPEILHVVSGLMANLGLPLRLSPPHSTLTFYPQIWFKIHSTSQVKFNPITKRIRHDMYLYKDGNYTFFAGLGGRIV